MMFRIMVEVDVSRMLLCRIGVSVGGSFEKKCGDMIGMRFMLMFMVMMNRLCELFMKLIFDSILMLFVVIILNIMMFVLLSMNGGIDVMICVIFGNRLSSMRIMLFVVYMKWFFIFVMLIRLMFCENDVCGNELKMLLISVLRLLMCRLCMRCF